MNELEFSFEPSPWEAYRMTRQMGDRVPAAKLLALVEGEDEQALEDALLDLETGCMELDISDLPKAAGHGETASRLRWEMDMANKGLLLEEIDAGDPLRLYLEEVAAMPAFGEEGQLTQRSAAGDEQAQQALTNLGLSRVIHLACEYVGYGVLLLDLIQEGSLGLWQAVRSYHGGDYEAHRDRWIRLYLARAVTMQARANGVGQKMRQSMEDYRQVDERLLGELGRNPTLEEIALELHMSLEEAAVVKKMLDDAQLLAKARGPEQDEADKGEEEQAVEDTALFQMRQRIGDLLSGLSREDAKVLSLRFGLEGGKPLTPEETGRLLHLTASQVLEKEAAALAQLRQKS